MTCNQPTQTKIIEKVNFPIKCNFLWHFSTTMMQLTQSYILGLLCHFDLRLNFFKTIPNPHPTTQPTSIPETLHSSHWMATWPHNTPWIPPMILNGPKKEQKSDSTKKSEIRLTLFAIQVLHFISTAWANLPMGHNYNGKKSPSPFKVKIAKQRQIVQRYFVTQSVTQFVTQWALFSGDNGNFGSMTSRIISLCQI